MIRLKLLIAYGVRFSCCNCSLPQDENLKSGSQQVIVLNSTTGLLYQHEQWLRTLKP